MVCPCDVSRFERLETLTRFSPNYRSILSSFNFSRRGRFFPASFLRFLSHFHHRCLLSNSNTFSFLLLSHGISSFPIISYFHFPIIAPISRSIRLSVFPFSRIVPSFIQTLFFCYSRFYYPCLSSYFRLFRVFHPSSFHHALYHFVSPISFLLYVALQPQDPLYPFHFAFPLSLSVCFLRILLFTSLFTIIIGPLFFFM